jgi:hypothetical protein
MICQPCARAADTRAPRDQHCTNPACMCGHKTERYGTTTALPPTTATGERGDGR